jgi:hypothetical protein
MSTIGSLGAAAGSGATQPAQQGHHHRRHGAKPAGAQETGGAQGTSATDPQLQAQLATLVGGTDKLSQLEQQLHDAVSSALAGAGSGTDPHQAVENAIDTTLKQNGVDPQAFRNIIQQYHSAQAGYDRNGAPVTPGAATAPALIPGSTASITGADLDGDGDGR